MAFGQVSAVVLTLVVSLSTGCTRGVYEIELTPRGEVLHREITFWRDTSGENARPVPVAPEELTAVAKAYGAEVPREVPDRPHFAADFRGTTPDDVGGTGWYQPLETPLGALRGYTERFRGQDDLSADLDQRFAALNRLLDLIAEFLQRETAGNTAAEPLHAFVKNDLRRDLRNLCLYTWAGCVVGHYNEKSDEEMGVRVAQYLIERRYFDAAAAPQVVQTFLLAADEDYDSALQLLQRIIARKTGIADDQPVPAYLAELFDEAHLFKLLDEFAAQTPEYRKLLLKWEEAKKTYPEQEQPVPGEVLMDLAIEAFWPGILLFETADALTVRLKLPVEPIMTNGEWDAASSLVHWSRRLLARSESRNDWPSVLYAFWTEPNGDFQKKHFGKVLLEKDGLAEYCLWHGSLNAAQTAAWDRFVEELEPREDLAERIKRFSFPGEPKVENLAEPPFSQADIAKSVLLQYLAGETWPPRTESSPEAAPSEAAPPAPAPPAPAP
jgi:hypothetical protein